MFRYLNQYRLKILALFMMLILALSAISQEEDRSFEFTHFPFMIRLEANYSDKSPGPGFGFAVRMDQEYLYFVTAFHNLYNKEVGRSKNIMTFRYGQSDSTKSEIINYDSTIDLALLRIPKPQNFEWYPLYKYAEANVGKGVLILGINDQWEIPSVNNKGKILSAQSNLIEVEFNRATAGSSGGPIFSGNKVIGMLLEEDPNISENRVIRILPVKIIRKYVDNWLPKVATKSSIFPKASLGIGPTLSAIPASFSEINSIVQSKKPSGWGLGGEVEIIWTSFISSKFQYARRQISGKKNWEVPFRNRMNEFSASIVFYPAYSTINQGLGFGLFAGINQFWHNPEIQIDGSSWQKLNEIQSINYQVPTSHTGFHLGVSSGQFGRQKFLKVNLTYIWTNGAYIEKKLPEYNQPDEKKDHLIVIDLFLTFSTKRYKKHNFVLSF